LYSLLIDHLHRLVRGAEADAILLVVVCERPEPEHETFLREAKYSMAARGVQVLHAVQTRSIATAVPWHCCLHDGCAGELPDPSASELAAVLTSHGVVAFDSRDDVVRLLDPADPARVTRISGLIDVAIGADHPSPAHYLSIVREAVANDSLPTHDDEFVQFALALSDHRVRDACFVFAMDGRISSAGRLWRELVRWLPAPERAEAAVLLAVCAYMSGDGVLANIALEKAREALPGHNLAGVLQSFIRFGAPAARLRDVLAGAAHDAERDIELDPGPSN
jgi:hypothetical protein